MLNEAKLSLKTQISGKSNRQTKPDRKRSDDAQAIHPTTLHLPTHTRQSLACKSGSVR